MANPKDRGNTGAETPNTGAVTPSREPEQSTGLQPDKRFPSVVNGKSGAATATARSFYDQAKATASDAYEAVTDKAADKLDEQKSTLSGGLATVADSVRQVSENLGATKTDSGLAEAASKYTRTASQKIENVAGYFENHSIRDMARDLEGFARRNPAIFIGAAFGLGLLAARFLKSSPPEYNEKAAGREFAATAGESQRRKSPKTKVSNAPDFGIGPV